MFYVTPNDHARQTRRIRDLTASVTDLLLRQGRLMGRICELTAQVNEADLRAEAAEARVREMETALRTASEALETAYFMPGGHQFGVAAQAVANALEARNG